MAQLFSPQSRMFSRTFPGVRNAGFTLIELLTVIAIIAILAAILIPVTRSVRERAHATKSLSNQREIFKGAILFANDNSGRLPDHRFDKILPWRSYAVFWDDLGGPGPEKGFGNLLAGGYVDSPEIFHSPLLNNARHGFDAFRAQYDSYLSGGDPGFIRAGYYLNPDRERVEGAVGGQIFSLNQIYDPSQVIMVMDIIADLSAISRTEPPIWTLVMADGSARSVQSEEVYRKIQEGAVSNNYGQFIALLNILLDR